MSAEPCFQLKIQKISSFGGANQFEQTQIQKALISSKIEIISIEVVLTFIPWYVLKFSLCLIVCSDAMITRHVDAGDTLGISINGVANESCIQGKVADLGAYLHRFLCFGM